LASEASQIQVLEFPGLFATRVAAVTFGKKAALCDVLENPFNPVLCKAA
jgi:hypothetical protein